ncbi:3-phosphoshikimate 1-carboxyvinyltransferase [Methanobacterium congolense]|uniref:3-phosphoshikimate 1-carboxyvinyltransferase n=1 Tax=Methanobacterium congolense TaxID=118062 RepID=A0A1D3L2L5_9EURY|nr:3-phosphoshikimate 1-carboxyvinyltransferase [Methanobacterium congolense]SCG85806.1 3-phosphoshikimate 1-carboxyvinyltransferase [Methanobacterium congolense]
MELTVQRTESVEGTVKAPPSKSYSHRAFILASLANGRSVVRDALYSEDTLASLEACRALGAEFERKSDGDCLIHGFGCSPSTPEDVLDVKNSGTTLRIMTSVSALAPGFTVFTGDDSLRQRPMQDLLDSLQNLGVNAHSTKNDGKAPLIVEGGFKGGKTSIPGNVSSQFISSLLIAAPYAENPVDINVKGDFISKPYVDMTTDVMKKFGVNLDYDRKNNSFHVEPQTYKSRDYTIEGDYSSASYIIGAAAALKSNVKIKNLFKDSKQGDKQILDIVKEMGAEVNFKKDEVVIRGHGKLNGVEVNLENAPDLLPTVAALGAIAEGVTTIKNVAHARFKETDRIHTCALELSKIGVNVKEKEDGLIIKGGANGGIVKSHGDHRLVMALSLVGLKVGNLRIENASVYDVSFPKFPEGMKELGCKINQV